jgi:ADP-ribose pyrophosphatase
MRCVPDGSPAAPHATLRVMPREESPRARVVGHRAVYDGRVLSLHVDEVEEPGGVRATREVVRHRGSVAMLAVSEDDRVVLVRQYRYAVDETLWELPAGRLDSGETPEQGARRELIEEVGLEAYQVEPLAVFYTTPGFCDELMHVFRATGLRQVPPRPEADERIEVRWFGLDEALAMIQRGEIREGKTLVALLREHGRRAGRS